ncbi:hypothetical protein DMC14_003205 [Metamycoplasma phocicerebrale]|uniref:Transmembrane protein n=1 Tax=Metamycoplasma phocicerebrale TaxID=142649 RepID=A0A3T0TUI3_9BACT|nr:hypothetical protein [Metamycoplasma phocicerebrale]AZZ65771.1 hypothetical protein DMC14_003205 [Metamycoplasma phocicerebrale]
MKIKNSLLILSAIPSVALIPTVVISGSLNKNFENKKQPDVAKDFDDFEKITKDSIKSGLEPIVDFTINYFENEKNKLIKDLEKDFKSNLEKLIYTQNIIQFLKKNKTEILKNPSTAFGFSIVFPFVLAKNKKYNISEISYENKTYENIKVGLNVETNYEEQIKPNGKIKKKNEEINSIEKKRLEKLTNDYLKSLNKELPKMLFNADDIPKIGKDIKISFGSWQDKENVINGMSFSVPEGYKSWEEYIIKNFHKKFVNFDLEQNKNFVLDEKQQNKDDDPLAKPDLVPGDKPKKKFDSEEQIQALPNLIPNISSLLTTKNADELISYFNSADEKNKSLVFFFNNPINTRYKYIVDSLEKNGQKVLANVKILDQVTKKFRPYKAELIINTSPEQKALNYVYEKIINENQKMYFKLIDALGVDEKINYELLRNDVLRDALYNLINAGVTLTNSEKYIKKSNDIISATTTNYLKNNSNYIVNSGIHESKYLLLTSLFSSSINSNDYFYYLSNSLKDVLLRFKAIIKINEKIITEKFNKSNYSLSTINSYYNLINMQISRLIASTKPRTFDIFNWYDYYVNEIKNIMTNFETLSLLVDNKPLSDAKYKPQFEKAYKIANDKIKINNKKNNKIINKVGYVLLGLSSLLILSSIIFIIIKRNSIKKLKINKLLITSTSIILAIIICSIIMIVL